jgi:hypothetical protein
MGPGDALEGEMRRHPRNSVPPLDPVTAERMLDGALHPEDAPPDYRDVLRVLAAASDPASVNPSAEAAALAVFRSARRPVETHRRTSVLSKLLSAKALAALALGAVSVGTAAAATGTLPDAAQATAHRLVAAVPDANQAGLTAESGSAAKANAGAKAAATAVGLCRAYASGRGGEMGGKLDAAAFEQLSAAAGSADGVEAYCAKVTAAAQAGSSSRAAEQDAALAGQCRSWLAAEGRTASLSKAVLDRLASAAGGADSIATYCSELVGQASAADQRPAAEAQPRPSATPEAPESPGGDSRVGSSPSHPAPPTPRG